MALVLACMCSSWTFAAAQGGRDSTATLVVQVMDTADTPVPLADVILRRAGMRGTSGATGRVTLRDIPPGIDTLLVRRLGYDPLVVAVRFFAGDTLSVEAVLDARLVALEEVAGGARHLPAVKFEGRSAGSKISLVRLASREAAKGTKEMKHPRFRSSR